MTTILSIPLFSYLLIAMNIGLYDGGDLNLLLDRVLFVIELPSGADITLTMGTAFILTGILFLYIEILKATRSSVLAIVDHALSMIVFIIFLVEFIVVEAASNPTFLILMCLTLTDVIAGFTVTISTARRDISLSH